MQWCLQGLRVRATRGHQPCARGAAPQACADRRCSCGVAVRAAAHRARCRRCDSGSKLLARLLGGRGANCSRVTCACLALLAILASPDPRGEAGEVFQLVRNYKDSRHLLRASRSTYGNCKVVLSFAGWSPACTRISSYRASTQLSFADTFSVRSLQSFKHWSLRHGKHFTGCHRASSTYVAWTAPAPKVCGFLAGCGHSWCQVLAVLVHVVSIDPWQCHWHKSGAQQKRA